MEKSFRSYRLNNLFGYPTKTLTGLEATGSHPFSVFALFEFCPMNSIAQDALVSNFIELMRIRNRKYPNKFKGIQCRKFLLILVLVIFPVKHQRAIVHIHNEIA